MINGRVELTQNLGAQTVRVHWSVELDALLSITAMPLRPEADDHVHVSAKLVSTWGEVAWIEYEARVNGEAPLTAVTGGLSVELVWWLLVAP